MTTPTALYMLIQQNLKRKTLQDQMRHGIDIFSNIISYDKFVGNV